jgi:penicillin V acylase-like amidase (Ntn superfamily)
MSSIEYIARRTSMRSQTLGILLLILCATVDPVNACTTFIYSDGEVTLGGNNEDHSNPLPMILFIPAEDGKYGRVYIGFENYRGRAEAPILQVQAGVNDHGLFFDSLAAPTVEVAPEGDKPCYMGNMMLRAMEECATVEEVLEIFDRYDHPGIVNDQLFIGDSTGDAVIIEPHTVVRKTGDFMIATNFLQSRTNPEDIDSPEYLTTEDMLGSASNVTVELFRDILEAVNLRSEKRHHLPLPFPRLL